MQTRSDGDAFRDPFTVQASPEELAELRARLRATRWPDAPEDAGWSLGTDLAYPRDLVAYWADGFDWTAQEKALSEFPRFRARFDRLGIHYVHAGPSTRPARCCRWCSATAGRTRSGATQRSSRC